MSNICLNTLFQHRHDQMKIFQPENYLTLENLQIGCLKSCDHYIPIGLLVVNDGNRLALCHQLYSIKAIKELNAVVNIMHRSLDRDAQDRGDSYLLSPIGRVTICLLH